MKSVFHPREPGFARLSIFEKYEAVGAALDAERRKSPADLQELGHLEELWFKVRARAALADPYWDMERHLWLADENRKDVLFSARPAQRKIADFIYNARMDRKPAHPHGRPVRLYIPKARRLGISQIIAAVFYLLWRNDPNTYALVMAHRADSAKEIFGKYRKFWAKDPMRPQLDRESTTELVAAAPHSSQLHVITGGVSDSSQGQAFGWQLVHVSEVAHLKNPNPEALLSGIMAAMPTPISGWSVWVEESTGKTTAGPFHDTCIALNAVQHHAETRDDDLRYSHLMFLPDYEREGSQLPFADHKARERFVKSMTEEELGLLDNYRPPEMSEEQFVEFLNWRRYVYEHEIKGSNESERRREQRRQHPIRLTDCFASSGGNAFDTDTVDSVMNRSVRKPLFTCDLTGHKSVWNELGAHVYDTPDVDLVRRADAPLTVWERARLRHSYCLGADPSRGLDAGDFAVAVVFDRTERRIVARYRDRIPVHQFVVVVRLLSKMYKDAVINAETNFDSSLVDMLAQTDRRRLLYLRKNPTGTDATNRVQMSYGTFSTNQTKNMGVSLMRQKLEKEPGMFVDRLLLEEMRVIQERYNPDTDHVKFRKPKGKHDDVYDATVMALIADEDSFRPEGTSPAELWRPPTITDYVQRFEREQGGVVTYDDPIGEMEMF